MEKRYTGHVKCITARIYNFMNFYMMYTGSLDGEIRVWHVMHEGVDETDRYINVRIRLGGLHSLWVCKASFFPGQNYTCHLSYSSGVGFLAL